MTKFLLSAAAVAVFAMPSMAAAQQASPSRADLRPNSDFQQQYDERQLFAQPEKASDAYEASQKIARCLDGRGVSGDLIGGALSDDTGYSALTNSLKGETRSCLRDTVGGLPMMVSASLAEERLKTMTFDDRAIEMDMSVAEPFYTPADGVATIDHIGRCMAVYSPGLTNKVFATRPGSDEEMAALALLYRVTWECGMAEVPDSVPTAFQRVALAHALYDWSQM